MSRLPILLLSHMLLNIPSDLLYKFRGVSNSCKCGSDPRETSPCRLKVNAYRDLTLVHDEDPVIINYSSETMSNTQQCFMLEFSQDGFLDLRICLKIHAIYTIPEAKVTSFPNENIVTNLAVASSITTT